MICNQTLQDIIWPRLDRYREAVIAGKAQSELAKLRLDLISEVSRGESLEEITLYMKSQFDQIDSRHLSM